jgi:hypothetical protein
VFGLSVKFVKSVVKVRLMKPEDYNLLYQQLRMEAAAVLEAVGPEAAFEAMFHEPFLRDCWWQGVFDQSDEDRAVIDAAARAFAHGLPYPDMTISQRARLSIRLRLCGRFVRALSTRQVVRPVGWFANKLRRLKSPELLESLLVDLWPFVAEMYDESMNMAHGDDDSVRIVPVFRPVHPGTHDN